jgi:hypothetical protein
VDDGDGLENRSGRKVTGGSNPSPSAKRFWIYDCRFAIVKRAIQNPKSAIENRIGGGAGVDDRGRLLSGCGVKSSTQGSNPCLPA